jgi:hypothetical protein
MQALLKVLRGFGPAGTFVANILAFLATNWVVTMTTIVSVWAGFSAWATDIVQKQGVQTTVIVFLASLWTYIGIVFLADRKKPREIKAAQDYRYGLTFEGMAPIYDSEISNDDDPMLSVGLQLRNYSSGPIRYDIETFDVRIGTRSLPKMKKGLLYGFMPRGGGRFSTNVGFKKSEIQEFMGKRSTGTVEVSISYGHPEHAPSRRLIMLFDLTIEFREGKLGFSSNIIEERDVPFSPMQ